MTWRSTTWARWLGWTVLYAVLLVGFFDIVDVLPKDILDVLPEWEARGWLALVLLFLVPALIAFVIGIRFRSWWWALGPLVACILPIVLLNIWSGLAHGWGTPGIPGLRWALFMLGAMLGGVSALTALAGVWLGVWWEERQEE